MPDQVKMSECNPFCLLCGEWHNTGNRTDMTARGRDVSPKLHDGIDYTFSICKACLAKPHLAPVNIERRGYCSACSLPRGAPEDSEVLLGVEFDDYAVCEPCLSSWFVKARVKSKPHLLDRSTPAEMATMSSKKPAVDRSEEKRKAIDYGARHGRRQALEDVEKALRSRIEAESKKQGALASELELSQVKLCLIQSILDEARLIKDAK